MERKKKFFKVILPLKFEGTATYFFNADDGYLNPGTRVKVEFAGKVYSGVIESEDTAPEISEDRIREINCLEELPPVKPEEILFWKNIAEYYMCTVGEVFRAAYPAQKKLTKKESETFNSGRDIICGNSTCRNGETFFILPTLSEEQSSAADKAKSYFAEKKPVLLYGVTGSGKTEIYMHLAAGMLKKGKNVLFMLPEIAISRQLSARLEDVFGEKVLVYHSGQTSKEKRRIQMLLSESGKEEEGKKAYLILGLRSSVFLPYANLGLIIIDEEHDSSYKQEDPAPRYNGRDAAIMLGKIHGADIIMGSATPSFESIYNCLIGRFGMVRLFNRYHGSEDAEIEIIDTIRAAKRKEMTMSFSKRLLEKLEETVGNGEQAVIFRSRRAYSPLVQCSRCGYIPKCPHCNVPLTYHKFSNSLDCHYCGMKIRYNTICPECSFPTLMDKGSGTEKLEEELRSVFPEMRIARYDADITKSRKEEQQILKSFSRHDTDVLIGTQMISKGFDFSNVTLAAIINADTIIGQSDFRADERAVQLISQLRGRAGRRSRKGTLVIQTAQPHNKVFLDILNDRTHEARKESIMRFLKERKDFNYPPFTRAVKIVIKDNVREKDKMEETGRFMASCLEKEGFSFNGPFAPPLEMIGSNSILNLWVWLRRDSRLQDNKRKIYSILKTTIKEKKYHGNIYADVDPL